MDKSAAGHKSQYKVTAMKGGPYPVAGGLPPAKEIIVHDDNAGFPAEWAPGAKCPEKETCTLCGSGKSSCEPFYDGTRIDTGFNDGDESLNQ